MTVSLSTLGAPLPLPHPQVLAQPWLGGIKQPLAPSLLGWALPGLPGPGPVIEIWGGLTGSWGEGGSNNKGEGGVRLPLCRSSSLACLEGRGSSSSAKGKQVRFRGSLRDGREGLSRKPGGPESRGPR